MVARAERKRGQVAEDELPKQAAEQMPARKSAFLENQLHQVPSLFKLDIPRKEQRARVFALVERQIIQIILSKGYPSSEIDLAKSSIENWAPYITYQAQDQFHQDNEPEDRIIEWVENEVARLANSIIRFNKNIAWHEPDDVLFNKLKSGFEKQFRRELRKRNVPDDEASLLSREIAGDFAQANSGGSLSSYSAALELAVTAVLVARRRSAIAGNANGKKNDESPIPLWVDREPGEFPTAESFLRRHYGPRLGIDGDLTQAELGRLDMALQTALSREFKGRRDKMRAMLPTVEERRNAQLQREYGYVPQGEDRKRKITALSRRPTPS